MLTSCHGRQEATTSGTDSTGIDTNVVRVAVMPAMNCLPVFYAERSRLADSLGFDMKLLRYQAQMDIDTAIANGHADIAFTDLIRIAKLSKAGVSLSPIASCDEALSLISLKTKRVKQINQMKEQMIAVSRLSATDYWCDRMLDSTRTSHDDIYRPQVNDVRLRTEMLRLGLIDAAMMGEPYATWMTTLGHKRLFRTQGKRPRLYAWASSTATKRQEKEFLALLDSALQRMKQDSEATLLRNILKEDYGLPATTVDSLALPPLSSTTETQEEDLTKAREWLGKATKIKK